MPLQTDADLSPRETAEALLARGREHTNRSEFAPAQECLTQALALSRQIGEAGLESDSLIRLGTVQYYLACYPEALSYYRQAQACLQGQPDPSLAADAADGIGSVYSCLSDVALALEAFAEAVALRRSLNDPSKLSNTLNNVGSAHSTMGDYTGALRYFEEGLEISRAAGDVRVEAFCLGNIANTSSILGQHAHALAAGQAAVEAARCAQAPLTECQMLLIWGDALTKAGQPADPLPLFTNALKIAQSLPNPNCECLSLSLLGQAALTRGDLEEAHTRLDQAIEIAEAMALKECALGAHQVLSEVCEQQGNLAAALTHCRRYHDLEREVFSEDADKRAKNLMIQMEVERSRQEAEIHRLRNVELVAANTALEEAGRRLQEQAELLETQAEALQAQAEELQAQNEELQAQSEALERQAGEDGLTSLANRRYLENWLALMFHKARQNGSALAVVMADVDHFKQVNDRFGHQIGDEVLMTVARLFRQTCRASDLAARYGGEEFVLVLPDTNAGQAFALCERLRVAVEHYDWQTVHPDLAVTLSLGLSDDCEVSSHERLLGLADAQLYAAKHAGRNRASYASLSLA